MAVHNRGASAGQPELRINLENPTINHLLDALQDTAAWLAGENIPYLVTGAVAGALLWRPHLTRHIAVLAAVPETRLFAKMASLPQYALAGEAGEASEPCTVYLRHATSQAGIAVTARDGEFERQAAVRALKVDLKGFTIRVATPEDYVVLQARAGAADADDVEAILQTYPQADRAYLLRYLDMAPGGASQRIAARLRKPAPDKDFPRVRHIVRM